MIESKRRTFLSNLFWRALERFGAQGVTFIVSIVLARVLSPDIYGTIALITVITSILQVLVDGGFSLALIQKKDSDDLDFSTVFFFNLVVCFVLYTLLFLFAPFLANFYNNSSLTSVIRVLGIVIIISGVKSIQVAYVSKYLQFKKFFFATLGGTVCAGILGIWMAYNGYGVWAIVIQNLINQAIDAIILWIIVKWRPKIRFSFTRLKGLFGFGWRILVSNLIDKTYKEIRSLIIGKKYSAEDLAYYNKGNQFPDLLASNIVASVDNVLLPVMSREQDDASRIKSMTRRAIKTSSFVLMPCMMGLAACSVPLISILLTEKWLPSVPYLIVFCITFSFYPIHTANLNAIKAMGRSDIFLKLEIIKKIMGFSIIFVTMWFGVWWIAIGVLISSIGSQIINSWPNRKLLNYSYFEQLKDIIPSFVLSFIMGFFVYFIIYFGLPNWLTLILQIVSGCLFYIGMAKLFKFDSLSYCMNTLKTLLRRSQNE